MAIFSHEYGMEPNVEYLEVLAPEGRNILRFLQQGPGDGLGDVNTGCTLDREAVERLYSTLGEWLYPTGVKPVADLTALGEALAKGLADMATAVQSLHLSPVAVVKVPGVEPEPLCARVCPSGAHAASRCTWCGHLWFEHLSNSPDEPEPQHGRLMSELPRRVRLNAGTDLCRCGDLIGVHGESGCGAEGCKCTWARVR